MAGPPKDDRRPTEEQSLISADHKLMELTQEPDLYLTVAEEMGLAYQTGHYTRSKDSKMGHIPVETIARQLFVKLVPALAAAYALYMAWDEGCDGLYNVVDDNCPEHALIAGISSIAFLFLGSTLLTASNTSSAMLMKVDESLSKLYSCLPNWSFDNFMSCCCLRASHGPITKAKTTFLFKTPMAALFRGLIYGGITLAAAQIANVPTDASFKAMTLIAPTLASGFTELASASCSQAYENALFFFPPRSLPAARAPRMPGMPPQMPPSYQPPDHKPGPDQKPGPNGPSGIPRALQGMTSAQIRALQAAQTAGATAPRVEAEAIPEGLRGIDATQIRALQARLAAERAAAAASSTGHVEP